MARTPSRLLGIGLVVALQWGGLMLCEHLILNRTASLPPGWYWRSRSPLVLARGQIIELTPPDLALPYLAVYPSQTNLLKRIAGVEGDTVCWEEAGMRVKPPEGDEHSYPRIQAQPLPPEGEGCAVLEEGKMLVVGDHKKSLDSRAIGTVSTRRVLYRVIPLYTWGGKE